MYRGTTPTLTFRINSEIDLNSIVEVWVTLKATNIVQTWTKNDLIIDAAEKTISLPLTQADTLELDAGSVLCQLRFLDMNDKAFASPVKRINLHNILKEGVIE